MSNIFTVTTFEKLKEVIVLGKTFEKRESRVVGFYHDKQDAIKAVEENRGDLCEAETNQYVLIEEVSQGLYPVSSVHIEKGQTWFRWDEENKKYRFSVVPEDLANLLNLSIG